MTLELTLSNIAKGYNGNQVLTDCSFSFNNNGIYVLTGPNGCGKSTLLRICALIEGPDRGEIVFRSDGTLINRDIDLKRRITLVLPKVGVFNTSVFRNVAYGLLIRDMARKEVNERVMGALEFAGLGSKKDQNALTLSSGETQRLGLARALVIEPEILFLDEPTASVDHKNTEIIEDLILRMRKERNTTIIITTHSQEQAAKLADTYISMDNGKLSVVYVHSID
jgi:tungstate transport system ATP-binding protein